MENKHFSFGTDGIRGEVGPNGITADFFLDLGRASGKLFCNLSKKPVVIVGKDTRISGYMLESALESGFTSSGMDVFLTGPIPTPAVAHLTQALRADLGVMITASHNTYEDNGFKLFGPDGYKLTDEKQTEINELMNRSDIMSLQDKNQIGAARRVDDALSRYIEFAKASFPNSMRLDHLKIVLDCANGAAYKVAPMIFWELGADVIVIGDKPNGRNINQDCGSTKTKALRKKVKDENADLGIAFDGDGDRLAIIDENGDQVNGDHLLAMIALSLKKKNLLKNNKVVSTIMANLSLENYLDSIDLKLIRANVGDRYVIEEMLNSGSNFGGEPSGHLIINDFSTTGDAIISSLQVLSLMIEENKSISNLTNLFPLIAQKHYEHISDDKKDISSSILKKFSKEMKEKIGNEGRIIIRKSGTEPLIRVMIETDNQNLSKEILDEIKTSLALL